MTGEMSPWPWFALSTLDPPQATCMSYQCVVTPCVPVSGLALLTAAAASRLPPHTRLCQRPLTDLTPQSFEHFTVVGCPSSISFWRVRCH